MAIPSDDSDLHLTLFAGAFAPHGVCETAQDVVEELNGLPLGRLGPRIQYMVRYIYIHIYIYTEVSKSVEECSMSFRQSRLEQN